MGSHDVLVDSWAFGFKGHFGFNFMAYLRVSRAFNGVIWGFMGSQGVSCVLSHGDPRYFEAFQGISEHQGVFGVFQGISRGFKASQASPFRSFSSAALKLPQIPKMPLKPH